VTDRTSQPNGARRAEGRRDDKPLRLFVAIVPPPAVRDAAAEVLREMRGLAPEGVRWVPPENVHLTLKFLGNVEPGGVAEVFAAADRAAAGVAPFELGTRGVGAFPSWRRPRVVWLGLDDSGPLARLASRVETAFAGIGFERETRGFSAHLTLGRVKRPGDFTALGAYADAHRDLSVGRWHVTRIAVMKSVLGREGATYEALHEAGLGAGNAARLPDDAESPEDAKLSEHETVHSGP